MKNFEIVNALNGIANVIKQQEMTLKNNPNAKRFPTKITFAINKNKQLLLEQYIPYRETLKTLDKETEKYSDELADLLNEEVEVIVKKVKESDFKDYEPTFAEIEALGFMIED